LVSSPDVPTAVITGAAGDIGRAMVAAFMGAGYQVLATDLLGHPDGLRCTRYLQADLERLAEDRDYADTVTEAMRAFSKAGGLDVLINNAALQILGGVDDLTRGDWRRSLGVNLVAPFFLAQALVKELEIAKGCVINISSVHARLTKRRFVAYATTKAALSGMTRALAVDLGPRVRVNAIEPGAIATSMLRAGFDGKTDLYHQLELCHPQERIGRPEEVANVALRIAGREMCFLHGACVPLDGGVGSRLFDPD
jgi:NAD(P)-dependent dehydrogenase (short-subunit alcohol dehydrogenase family)